MAFDRAARIDRSSRGGRLRASVAWESAEKQYPALSAAWKEWGDSRGCGTKNLVSEAAMAAPLTITEFDTYDLRFPTSRHLRGTTTTATPAAVARTIQVSRA
jgi:hypothetical protein